VPASELADPFATQCLADYGHLQKRYADLPGIIASAPAAARATLDLERNICGSMLDKMEAQQSAGELDPFDYAALLQVRLFRDIELCKVLFRRKDSRAGAVKGRAAELKASVDSLVEGEALTAAQLVRVKEAARSIVYKRT
jgi:hypothetical protein